MPLDDQNVQNLLENVREMGKRIPVGSQVSRSLMFCDGPSPFGHVHGRLLFHKVINQSKTTETSTEVENKKIFEAQEEPYYKPALSACNSCTNNGEKKKEKSKKKKKKEGEEYETFEELRKRMAVDRKGEKLRKHIQSALRRAREEDKARQEDTNEVDVEVVDLSFRLSMRQK